MFAAFFYLLRQRGLHVSLNEWMTLLEGMEKGLHHSTLTGFYHLCRAIVVKNETEFDRFDQIFLEFFKDVPYTGELPEDLLDWLNHPSEDLKRTIADLRAAGFPDETLEELAENAGGTSERADGGAQRRQLLGGDSGPHPLGQQRLAPQRYPDRRAVHAPHRHDGSGGAEIPGLPEGQHAGHPPVPDGLPHAAAAVRAGAERRKGTGCGRHDPRYLRERGAAGDPV